MSSPRICGCALAFWLSHRPAISGMPIMFAWEKIETLAKAMLAALRCHASSPQRQEDSEQDQECRYPRSSIERVVHRGLRCGRLDLGKACLACLRLSGCDCCSDLFVLVAARRDPVSICSRSKVRECD